jgi:hypothetical protein
LWAQWQGAVVARLTKPFEVQISKAPGASGPRDRTDFLWLTGEVEAKDVSAQFKSLVDGAKLLHTKPDCLMRRAGWRVRSVN